MKIAIDISQSIYGTGVSRYTKNIVNNLLMIDKSNDYVLFGGSLRRRKELQEMFVNRDNCMVKTNFISPNIANILWNKIHYLPVELFIGKTDILHTSDWSEPFSFAKKVTTIHDLSPIFLAKETPLRIVELYKDRLKWVKSESKGIIVPSNQTKKDLVDLGYNENKIWVIAESVSENFYDHHKLSDRVKDKYGLTDKYILCVGTAPRKNISKITLAFNDLFKKKLIDQLVVVGNIPTYKDPNVTYLGFVPDDELPQIYSGAMVFVYASLYEGFGLPLLEAYSQQIPTVASEIPCLKEVGTGASVFVDPNSPSSILLGIKEAIKNRNKYIKMGRKKLDHYSWKDSALKTLKIYKDVYEN